MDAPSPRDAARRLRNVKLGDARVDNASNRSPGRREVLAMIWIWIFCWKEILAKEVGLKKTHKQTHLCFFVVVNICATNGENCLSCFKSWLVEYLGGNDIATKQSGESNSATERTKPMKLDQLN